MQNLIQSLSHQLYICVAARPPEAPILDVSNSNVSATINWMIPGGTATKYYVSCTDGYYIIYHSHSHNESSVHLSGLTPFTNYTCCVSGVDSNNVVGLENCSYFQTHIGSKMMTKAL